jgi:iron complex outermembrane receptor protein
MIITPRLRGAVSGLAMLAGSLPLPAAAQDTPDSRADDILVIAERQTQSIENAPTSRATVTAAQIATTVNAVNVEDTLKYLPSLVVRKRHIGDTQAPLATRTSGLGASARSLVYADGALLSALIGNNNTSASPRWGMVSPEEIARIDVLYGPFSAAYPGNAIGAVVSITTRLPDRLEGTLSAGTSVQTFDLYGAKATLPSYQLAGTLGDRFGRLAVFGSVTHTTSTSQPTTYVTATANPAGTTGGVADRNRTGAAIRVLGSGGIEHQAQDTIKLKAAFDVSDRLRLTYVGGLFRNDTDSTAETYLTALTPGAPVYTSAFSSGVYRYDQRHWSHALSATGTGARFDWQVIGTLYDFATDTQRTPTALLPAAFTGGAGNITRLDGTGWETFDAKGAWRSDAAATHTISAGVHWDRFEVNSNRYATTDWIAGPQGALNQASRGKTRTVAGWAQDEVRIAAPLTLTVGGRYEDWRAYDGFNFSTTPVLSVAQPTRRATGFSPKATLAFVPVRDWTVRASFGKAYRFPTVGELYQAVTTGAVLTVPDPNLRPERALSGELALEHRDASGTARLSLFTESIDDALIAQSAPLVAGSATAYSYVQNVERTRARGVELAGTRTDFPVRGVDLSGSATYTDATTRKDTAFPAAVGKLLPSVPHWKATAVATWRPTTGIALTAAARYASRNYATLDNSDTVGNTYMGFYRYLVVDLRARVAVTPRYAFAVGVDNVTNDRYFLFHPFPQRSVSAEVTARL